jgi:hypothetical protein
MRRMGRVRWYRSFYWRIAITFVVLVLLVLVAQGALSTYLTQRPSARSPNNLALVVAAEIGALLAREPQTDLDTYLRREHSGGRQSTCC